MSGALGKAGRSLRTWLGLVLLLGCCLEVGLGCRTARYYAQAARGQAQILRRQRPIRAVIADPATPPELGAKLQLVLELTRFAETNLGLPSKGNYLAYADLGRPFAVWNVYAPGV